MARSRPHAILRNGTDVVARFGSHIQAEEAYYDLGCYVERTPTPEDQFEVVPEDDPRVAAALERRR